MCQPSENFIFCTCADDPKPVLVGEYKWTLDRYIGAKESKMKGKILMASKDLGASLTRDRVIDEMNSRNCFDFDYEPREMDRFHIDNGQRHPEYQYFSLLYREGQWQPGNHPPFGRTIAENVAKGRVSVAPDDSKND